MTLSERLKKSGARVRLYSLPGSVRGFCYHDDDLNSYIIINADLDRGQQIDTLQHELRHIERGDMYNEDFREYKN